MIFGSGLQSGGLHRMSGLRRSIARWTSALLELESVLVAGGQYVLAVCACLSSLGTKTLKSKNVGPPAFL